MNTSDVTDSSKVKAHACIQSPGAGSPMGSPPAQTDLQAYTYTSVLIGNRCMLMRGSGCRHSRSCCFFSADDLSILCAFLSQGLRKRHADHLALQPPHTGSILQPR